MQDEFETKLTIDGFVVVDGQRRGAALHLDQTAIETEDGVQINWRQARLRRDDADDALLVVGRTATVGSSDPSFLRAIESAAGNDLDRELARLQGLTTGWRGSQTVGCLMFFILTVWGIGSVPGCYRSAIETTIDAMPASVDEQLGEAAQDSIDVGPELDDEVVLDTITAMVERLSKHFADTDLAAGDIEWRIRVIESDQLNAFALPGGYITVFTALIAEAETPDMVAGVLAHEMAHVLQRHGLKRVGNQLGLIAGLRLVMGDTGGLIGLAGEILTMAIGNEWGRDQETEADVLGTGAMVRAGLDANALAEFFLLLKAEYGDVPDVLAWMSTHPMHDERVKEIRAIIDDMESVERVPLDIDWDDIRARVGAEGESDSPK